MKKVTLICLLSLFVFSANAQKHYDYPMPDYTPTQGNLDARKEFQDMKFGMFIHWGIYSVLADGEWVMFLKKVKADNYERLAGFFNPQEYNAEEWVKLAKKAGMKYITVTSRHHDSFSMFDTDASDFNIVDATPYKKDPLKELAEACKKEGIKLNFYYSLLDWKRDDYKQGKKGDEEAWNKYIAFMKVQLTELLTNYGEIGCIWFDGHWDQKRGNWHYDEIYSLIHELSPSTLIANNHHIQPIPGDDIQTFERDLPGENHGGFSDGVKVSQLPLESCATMAGKWGYSIYDKKFKSTQKLIHFLVNAAGKNGNLLLNVGPMPNGKIQPEFVTTLGEIGEWTSKYGESIYGTRGNIVKPQSWGTVTKKGNTLYVHVLEETPEAYVFMSGFNGKVKSARLFDGNKKIKFKQVKEGVFLYPGKDFDVSVDGIIKLEIK